MTITTINIQDVQQPLAELLKQVANGTEIIFMEGNQPRARLVPMNLIPARRIPGLHAGSMSMSPDFDAPLPVEFGQALHEIAA